MERQKKRCLQKNAFKTTALVANRPYAKNYDLKGRVKTRKIEKSLGSKNWSSKRSLCSYFPCSQAVFSKHDDANVYSELLLARINIRGLIFGEVFDWF